MTHVAFGKIKTQARPFNGMSKSSLGKALRPANSYCNVWNHSYQHIITGSKSPTPDDFLGGILADDMGLGKSLTMLCAILGSLARASLYGAQMPSVGHHSLRTAKSTLIVVPSACTSSIQHDNVTTTDWCTL
jgi:SNF2 family DNA or RNA helicase